MAKVNLPKNLTCVLDKSKALREPPLGMIVMAKGMRHTWVPFYSNFITSLTQQPAIKFTFISLKITLCRDDMCSRKVFERRSEHGSANPILGQDLFLNIYKPLAMEHKSISRGPEQESQPLSSPSQYLRNHCSLQSGPQGTSW